MSRLLLVLSIAVNTFATVLLMALGSQVLAISVAAMALLSAIVLGVNKPRI